MHRVTKEPYFSSYPLSLPHGWKKTALGANIRICTCNRFTNNIETRRLHSITPSAEGKYDVQWATTQSATHISIDIRTVSLSSSECTAISYVWGQYNRRSIPIGHSPDYTKTYTFNLAEEWHVPHLLVRLAELCEDDKTIWLDQLCLLQDDISDTLARIPHIYSSLDVVVLLPGGALCDCFEKVRQEGWKHLVDKKNYFINSDCANGSMFGSYVGRIWTMQEFRYARTLRVVWNEKEKLSCAWLDHGEFEKLNPFTQFWLARQLERWKLEDALEELQFARMEVAEALGTICTTNWQEEQISDVHLLSGMKCGPRKVDVIDWDQWTDRYPILEKVTADTELAIDLLEKVQAAVLTLLRRLVFSMYEVGGFKRTATKERDYIVAVWASMPGYKIPTDYRTLEVTKLLEDAIKQMEQKYHATPVSLTASSLFGEGEGLWRPTMFLSGNAIESSVDLYGPICLPTIIVTYEGRIPLRWLSGIWTKWGGESRRKYDEVFGALDCLQVVKLLRKVVGRFSPVYRARLGDFDSCYASSKDARQDQDMFELECNFILEIRQDEDVDDEEEVSEDEDGRTAVEKVDWKKFKIDHSALVYKIVCYLVGMNEAVCRNKGLEVVLTTDKLPRIGLRNLKFPISADNKAISATLAPRVEDQERCLFGHGLFDVIELHDPEDTFGVPVGKQRRFIPIGVWVPTVKYREEEVVAAAIEWSPDLTVRGLEGETNAWFVFNSN